MPKNYHVIIELTTGKDKGLRTNFLFENQEALENFLNGSSSNYKVVYEGKDFKKAHKVWLQKDVSKGENLRTKVEKRIKKCLGI